MKKIFLSTLAIFSFVIFTNAQSLHLGIKGGVNFSKVSGESFNDGFDAGFQVGGYASLNFNKYWGIQPEILFSQTNTKYDTSTSEIATPSSFKNVHLNYLSVPILLKINASKIFSINVGPQYSILTNSHQTVLQNAGDAIKHGDFAMVAGAQLNFGGINFYGRYNIGLSNLHDVANEDTWKSQQIQLGIGLRLL